MNQGLLIVLLTILILLLSCKVFNYCVLKELFVNREQVREMMNNVFHTTNLQGNCTQEDLPKECSSDQLSMYSSAKIQLECSNAEVGESANCADPLLPSICKKIPKCNILVNSTLY